MNPIFKKLWNQPIFSLLLFSSYFIFLSLSLSYFFILFD